MILHDQEIMDYLYPKDEDVSDAFGNCLSDCEVLNLTEDNTYTKEKVIPMMNEILSGYVKIHRLISVDDDGYFWEVDLLWS